MYSYLSLTSSILEGSVSSNESKEKIIRFLVRNEINNKLILLISTLFKEAQLNKFKIFLRIINILKKIIIINI